jgi:arylsulfatase
MNHTRRDFLGHAAVGGAAALAPRLLGGRAAPAPPKAKPNIVILMTDQERYPMWTPDLPLPARDWIAKRGVSFERFHHSAVQCSPSRSTIFTGLSTTQTGIFGNFLQGYQYSMDPALPTLGDLMRDQGYATAYFGKWHLSFAGFTAQDPEATLHNARGNYLGAYGFDHSQQSLSLEPVGYNDGYYNDPLWTREAIDWLAKHGKQRRPWILVVSLLNPHDIAYFPRGFVADFQRPDWGAKLPPNFEDDPSGKPHVHQQYHGGASLITSPIEHGDKKTWLRLLNTYCDLIVNTDDNLAALLEAIHGTGQLDDTVIIRTSDHGELAGSHGMKGKGPMIYEEQIRMPFVVSWPKRFAQGVSTPALGEAVDLVPTCLELGGLKDPVARYPWLRGKSLVPVLDAPATAKVKDATVTSCDENWSATEQFGVGKPWKKHVRALLTGRYKIARYYAVTGGGLGQPRTVHLDEQELEAYDLHNDPLELRNLARDPAHAALVADLHAWLIELESERFAALTIPRYGTGGGFPLPKDPIGNPVLPVLKDMSSEPREVRTGRPGAYVQLPVENPHLERLVYRDLEPRALSKRRELTRAMAEARAANRAAMLCQLHP